MQTGTYEGKTPDGRGSARVVRYQIKYVTIVVDISIPRGSRGLNYNKQCHEREGNSPAIYGNLGAVLYANKQKMSQRRGHIQLCDTFT